MNRTSIEPVHPPNASHPDVVEVAVVARPDARFGERPVAIVRQASGSGASEVQIIDHVRGRLAHFKAPSEVIFRDELPRTATGKVQKFLLRQQLRSELAQRGSNEEVSA